MVGGADDIENLVQLGDVLAGKYRIDRILGKGGMGVVVAAHHLQLDERVAIKFLLPAAVAKADLLQRFEREARAAVKIKSEHVAHVIDVGVLDTGSPYMVMEYLEGVDLSQLLTNEGAIPFQQAADFVLQACEAIVEAHALGIVHRDLKPANLFVLRRADGLLSIKVLDFGISKTSVLSGSGGGSDMTQTQSMLGSPFYMSPEQMQSARSVDMRTDIWALGCILFQCVTNEVPFDAETLPELVLKIVTQAPPPMRQFRQDIAPAFEHVVLRCLEKDRGRRYQHIGELAVALAPFAPNARNSAERIIRVVQTSGLGTPAASQRHPSSANVPSAKLATQHLQSAQAYALAPPPHPSATTGPSLFDSRSGNVGPPGGTMQYMPQPSGPPLQQHQMMSSPPPGTPPPGAGTGSNPRFGVTSSSGTWGNTQAGNKTSGATMALAIVGALTLLAAIGIAVVLFGRQMGMRAGTPDASASIASSASVPPFPSATVSVAVEPPVVADAADVVDASVSHPVPTVPTTTVTVPNTAPNPPPTVPTATTPKPPAPNCNPPYYFDEKKNRVFKKECL